jgi:hypothetical protein
MRKINLISEKNIDGLTSAKVNLKWEKILKECASINPDITVNLDHNYVNLSIWNHNMYIIFQWVEGDKDLYLTFESSELIRTSYTGKQAFYDTSLSALMGYLLHQDIGCHHFKNIQSVFEFIYMFTVILNNTFES